MLKLLKCYAECCVVMLSVIMLSVVILSVVMLSVVAPKICPSFKTLLGDPIKLFTAVNRPNVKNLSWPLFMNALCNLKCLFLAGFSCLGLCLWEVQELRAPECCFTRVGSGLTGKHETRL